MHLRQALLFSSQDAALYKTMRQPGYREQAHYWVRIQMSEQERQSAFFIGPHLVSTTIYELTIYRDKTCDGKHLRSQTPHCAKEFAAVIEVEAFLSKWRFDIAILWIQEEPEDQANG